MSCPCDISAPIIVSNGKERLSPIRGSVMNHVQFATHILYLEPSDRTPLKSRLLKYFEISEKIYGRNEAHLYHPHSSMTGFFKVSYEDQHSLWSKQQEMISALKEIVGCHLGDEKQPQNPVTISKINVIEMSKPLLVRKEHTSNKVSSSTSSKYIMQAFPTVRLEILAPWFRNVASDFGKRIELIGIQTRPKKVDHISLAYMHHFTIPRYMFEEMQQKAIASSSSSSKKNKKPNLAKDSLKGATFHLNPSSQEKGQEEQSTQDKSQSQNNIRHHHFRVASSHSLNISGAGGGFEVSSPAIVVRRKSFAEELLLLERDPFHIYESPLEPNHMYSFRHTESSSVLNELLKDEDNPNDPVPIPINLNGLHTLAQSILDLKSNTEDLKTTSWDIALYQESFHSEDLGSSHKFKEIFRIQKICPTTKILSNFSA